MFINYVPPSSVTCSNSGLVNIMGKQKLASKLILTDLFFVVLNYHLSRIATQNPKQAMANFVETVSISSVT